VRKDVRPSLRRVNYGYYGMSAFESHIYPHDEPGDTIVDYAFSEDANGSFALGTHAHTPIAILDHSLDYLLRVSVANIQAHAQKLIGRLKEELPERGFDVITPPEATTPMVACALPNAREAIGERLAGAGVKITLSRNRFRVSVSVFNDMNDIDRLLSALGRI
jgi:selenocysteine lyase/cysteine desulfurase